MTASHASDAKEQKATSSTEIALIDESPDKTLLRWFLPPQEFAVGRHHMGFIGYVAHDTVFINDRTHSLQPGHIINFPTLVFIDSPETLVSVASRINQLPLNGRPANPDIILVIMNEESQQKASKDYSYFTTTISVHGMVQNYFQQLTNLVMGNLLCIKNFPKELIAMINDYLYDPVAIRADLINQIRIEIFNTTYPLAYHHANRNIPLHIILREMLEKFLRNYPIYGAESPERMFIEKVNKLIAELNVPERSKTEALAKWNHLIQFVEDNKLQFYCSVRAFMVGVISTVFTGFESNPLYTRLNYFVIQAQMENQRHAQLVAGQTAAAAPSVKRCTS